MRYPRNSNGSSVHRRHRVFRSLADSFRASKSRPDLAGTFSERLDVRIPGLDAFKVGDAGKDRKDVAVPQAFHDACRRLTPEILVAPDKTLDRIWCKPPLARYHKLVDDTLPDCSEPCFVGN